MQGEGAEETRFPRGGCPQLHRQAAPNAAALTHTQQTSPPASTRQPQPGWHGGSPGEPRPSLNATIPGAPHSALRPIGQQARIRSSRVAPYQDAHARGQIGGAWNGGTNLDLGVFQPKPGPARHPTRHATGHLNRWLVSGSGFRNHSVTARRAWSRSFSPLRRKHPLGRLLECRRTALIQCFMRTIRAR